MCLSRTTCKSLGTAWLDFAGCPALKARLMNCSQAQGSPKIALYVQTSSNVSPLLASPALFLLRFLGSDCPSTPFFMSGSKAPRKNLACFGTSTGSCVSVRSCKGALSLLSNAQGTVEASLAKKTAVCWNSGTSGGILFPFGWSPVANWDCFADKRGVICKFM